VFISVTKEAYCVFCEVRIESLYRHVD